MIRTLTIGRKAVNDGENPNENAVRANHHCLGEVSEPRIPTLAPPLIRTSTLDEVGHEYGRQNSVRIPLGTLRGSTRHARIDRRQNRVATSLLESATPGFTVWDLRGTMLPFKKRNLTLVGGIENFTDKQYREHLDFRSLVGASVFQPGISFYVGADANY